MYASELSRKATLRLNAIVWLATMDTPNKLPDANRVAFERKLIRMFHFVSNLLSFAMGKGAPFFWFKVGIRHGRISGAAFLARQLTPARGRGFTWASK